MKTIAISLVATLIAFNAAIAGVRFIPKEGKLWVEASGELVILESKEARQEYFALKIEDGRLYILTGELSAQLKKLAGEKIAVDGLLRERIEFNQEAFPSIEIKSVRPQ